MDDTTTTLVKGNDSVCFTRCINDEVLFANSLGEKAFMSTAEAALRMSMLLANGFKQLW